MSGVDLLFGLRAHWGAPKAERAEARLTFGWSVRTRKDTGLREATPSGVVHEIARMTGLSYKRRWFLGVFTWGDTVDLAAADLRARAAATQYETPPRALADEG